MPKSKRDKKVSLTKTIKKGLPAKQQLVEDVRNSIEKYKSIYVFATPSMRNRQLKDIRAQMKSDSRFFFGKNKVMMLALGKKKSEEMKKNVHLISKYLKGQCGLLFTDKPEEEVTEYFNNFVVYDYPRAGFVAKETVVIPEGPLTEFPHSLEPQLRQLGLATSLQKGIVTLTKEHKVCKKGKALTSEQARLLKLFNNKMAEFRIILICKWSKDGFVAFETNADNEEKENEDEEKENEDEEKMDED